MKIELKWRIVGLTGLALLGLGLQGCSTGFLIGDAPSDPPPQIVYMGARDAKGNEYQTWENVSSFGPVPAAMKASADQRCMQLGSSLRALGYHPAAKDPSGKTMTDGGFFCSPTLMDGNKSQ